MITISQIAEKFLKQKKATDKLNKAAILIPIIKVDDQLTLIYQVRSKNLRWQPGDICFPGGHIEKHDLSPDEAAKRETCEELGIPANQIVILGALPKITATFGLVVYPFVAEIKSLSKINLNKKEVETIFTVPIDWLIKNKPQTATMQVGHKPASDFPFDLILNRSREWQKTAEHKLYYYHYDEYVIWGLTAQITKNFIETIS